MGRVEHGDVVHCECMLEEDVGKGSGAMRGCAVRGTERRREEGRHIYLNEHGWWKLVLAGAGYLAHPNPSIRLSHGVTLEAVDPVTPTHSVTAVTFVRSLPTANQDCLPNLR